MRFLVPPAVFWGELQRRRSSNEVYSWGVGSCGDRRCGLRATGRGALLLERVRDGVRAPRLRRRLRPGLLSPSHVPGLGPAVLPRLVLTRLARKMALPPSGGAIFGASAQPEIASTTSEARVNV